MSKSPEELAHVEWLGYVQPVGLVVSVPAMLEAQCYVNKNIMAEHARLLNCLARDSAGNVQTEVQDLHQFVQSVLGWEADDLITLPVRGPLPPEHASLEVVLPQYHETLRPTHVVPEFTSSADQDAASKNKYVLLVQEHPSGVSLDEPLESDSAKHWNASPQAKFERLLRETGVPIGLLFNRSQFRLVYAPRGETSGYATFNVDEMAQVAGRPMFAALHMLLGVERLFSLADKQRLPYILENSRKYQNTVSTALAQQVMSALFELLRGFQAADDHRKGELLREVLANNPQHVYHGLLTVLMRMVFVLYAEDRSLMSSDPVYSNFYSINGLFERLRADAGQHPDTMDQRFGAWSQLLTLFRLIYEGGQHADFKLPARKGYLFDPDRYPFLEGRYDDGDVSEKSSREAESTIQIPRVSDGVIYRVLEDLSILDGERLSYRTLDVEQVGSVYETIMGFDLQLAEGKSIAIKPVKSHGAPTTINLESLLSAKPSERAGLLKQWSDQTLGAADAAALKGAETIEDVLAALDKKIAKHVTPSLVPAQSMVFQPSDERRRSGSHYTPRSLTEPIVRTTLEPILKRLCDPDVELPKVYEPSRDDKRRYTHGEIEARTRQSERAIEYAKAAREKHSPHPNQLLDLKICDPAMGSGAFLVEVCRQLGDELIKAWYAHDMVPTDIPPDEDETLYARRTVAQRCLYGVDKNVMAVDLAKLSLWLVTLAKDHPFTFLDHSLRHGDSLVGLTREQIIRFDWEPKKQMRLGEDLIQKRLDRATEARAKILNAREDTVYRDQEERMALANESLNLIRLLGDACVSCFFAANKERSRERELERVYGLASSYLSSLTSTVDFNVRAALQAAADRLQAGSHAVPCFHWEIEFPEVFSRENGGFDTIVGNPPFLGGRRIKRSLGEEFFEWLQATNDRASGNADLVAFFFRCAYSRLRAGGCIGFIATNSIAQGDTRQTGLAFIRTAGNGQLYNVVRRLRWPGQAAVVVSVVHISKSVNFSPSILDGKVVGVITSFFFHRGGDDMPRQLSTNAGKCYQGVIVLGMGFTFDDCDHSGLANPISLYRDLVARNPKNHERIFPFIGGEETNSSPSQVAERFVINFSDFPLKRESMDIEWADCDEGLRASLLRNGVVPSDYPHPVAEDWPDLLRIVEERVKPERTRRKSNGDFVLREPLPTRWWQYADKRPELYRIIKSKERVLVNPLYGSHLSFIFLPARMVFANKLNVLSSDSLDDFSVLQCRVHEIWARHFSSTLKDDLAYTPSDCFETFPFPLTHNSRLSSSGGLYYEYRRQMMISNNQGLTATYNRFHSPDEQDPVIFELRRLHREMDESVLRAYGWNDLADQAAQPDFCQFLLDYGDEEDDVLSDATSIRKRRRPWRYRWPDDFRDEVLARLLELNEQRHKEEMLLVKGKLSEVKPKEKPSNKQGKNKTTPLLDGLDQVEISRDERLLLLVVDAFKLITRAAMDEAFIAMKYPKLRKSRLGLGDPPKSVPRTDPGRDALIGGLVDRGILKKHPSDHQQVWKLGANAPSPAATSVERQALEETKAIFQKSIDSGDNLASCNQGVTDAKPGLVSIA
jgi:hypothetical protein